MGVLNRESGYGVSGYMLYFAHRITARPPFRRLRVLMRPRQMAKADTSVLGGDEGEEKNCTARHLNVRPRLRLIGIVHDLE